MGHSKDASTRRELGHGSPAEAFDRRLPDHRHACADQRSQRLAAGTSDAGTTDLGPLVLGESAIGRGWISTLASVCWVLALASALAGKSLEDGVRRVLQALPADRNAEPIKARQRLSWIVGRDTTELSVDEILRATAETASENAVDGLFAPLFWMLVGAGLWSAGLTNAPGPLALAWSFKAASTLDSMLGYRKGRLRWLGTAGARLDDLLTWLPCRLVMLTLPLVSQPIGQWAALVMAAEHDGQHDPSPNAGRSEAIYAHCAEVQLGGRNRYGTRWIDKPLLGNGFHGASEQSVATILNLSRKIGSALATDGPRRQPLDLDPDERSIAQQKRYRSDADQ